MDRARVSPENLRDALHSEIRGLKSGVEWVSWLDAAVALRNYSFRNVVLITLQMPYASQVARSDIWAKFGRSIAENQRNRDIRILAPAIQGRRGKTAELTGADLEFDRARQARGGGRLLGFNIASVWDVSQTDGTPLPPPTTPGGTAPTAGLWRALSHQVHSAGYTLVEGNTGLASIEGFTDHHDRTVVIRKGLDDVTAVARLAHEVAHLRMHDPRRVTSAGSIMCRGMREIEAESVAYILMAHHGLSTGGSSFRYVASWAAGVNKHEPEKVIERTGNRVVSAARRLIQTVDRDIRRMEADRDRRPARRVELSSFGADPQSRSFSGPEW
jgi:hypothetical protein